MRLKFSSTQILSVGNTTYGNLKFYYQLEILSYQLQFPHFFIGNSANHLRWSYLSFTRNCLISRIVSIFNQINTTELYSYKFLYFDRQTLFKGLERVKYNTTDGFTGHAWTVDKDQEAATEALGKNPWSLRQHQREINSTLNGEILRKEVDMLELCEEIGLRNPKTSISKEPYTKGNFDLQLLI